MGAFKDKLSKAKKRVAKLETENAALKSENEILRADLFYASGQYGPIEQIDQYYHRYSLNLINEWKELFTLIKW